MSVYRRRSGRYAVLIDLEPTTGGRRRKSIGTYRTRKEAERAERKALGERDRGIDLVPESVTVAGLMARYIAYCRADGRTIVTLESYEQKRRRYIEPRLGSLQLAKLRPAHIAEWKVWLQTKGGGNGQPLGPKSVRNIYGVLHAAWMYALGIELVSRNIFVGAAEPPTAPRPNAEAFTAEETRKLMGAAASTRWSSFVALALATGARRGELCALSWTDVDFEARTLTIARSLAQTKGRVEMKSTKTGNVRRLTLSR
jgi:integrase